MTKPAATRANPSLEKTGEAEFSRACRHVGVGRIAGVAHIKSNAGATRGRLVKHAHYYWLLLAEGRLTRRPSGATVRRWRRKPKRKSCFASPVVMPHTEGVSRRAWLTQIASLKLRKYNQLIFAGTSDQLVAYPFTVGRCGCFWLLSFNPRFGYWSGTCQDLAEFASHSNSSDLPRSR